jgi:hypothetical protein
MHTSRRDEGGWHGGGHELWAVLVGVFEERFRKLNVKSTTRRRCGRIAGESSPGCLAIYVTKSAGLYRRVKGWWYGIVVGANRAA